MIINTLIFSVSLLIAKFLYLRNKLLQPQQLLLGRSFFATIICLLVVNVNIKQAMYDRVPRPMYKSLFLRCILQSLALFLDFTFIKYFSLVFRGMLTSLTPIFTMILSFCFNDEKFKVQEIFFTVITLSAVTAISMGMTFEKNKGIDEDDKVSI